MHQYSIGRYALNKTQQAQLIIHNKTGAKTRVQRNAYNAHNVMNAQINKSAQYLTQRSVLNILLAT